MILPNPDHFSTAATPSLDTDTATETCRSNNQAPSRFTPTERSDLAELVARAQAGDRVAQTELVRSYTRRISGYARLIIRQPDAVEDVVQMVFIKMFRRLGRLRDVTSFESWLFRLARNTAVDFIRRRRCRPVTIPVEIEAHDIPDPADANSTREIMDALEAALSHVTPTDRELVTLFVEGNSYQSLARKNGLTMGAVKARLHRLRPFLRAYVGGLTESRPASHERGGAMNRLNLAA
jgi:RNA polymerase sigma-70 factor, ECF subfamily